MIIRRMADAIREQNWFTVIIEIFILVFGILAALQVDTWRLNQQEAAEERVYIDRLIAESESLLIKAAEYHSIYEDIKASNLKLITHLNNKGACKTVSDDVKILMLQATDFPPPRFAFTTINELIQSGQMPLIRSDKLRLKISQMNEHLTFLVRQWTRYIEIVGYAERSLSSTAGFTTVGAFNRPIVGEGNPDDYRFDTMNKLCDSPAAIAEVANAVFVKNHYVNYLSIFVQDIERYLAALLEYKGSLQS